MYGSTLFFSAGIYVYIFYNDFAVKNFLTLLDGIFYSSGESRILSFTWVRKRRTSPFRMPVFFPLRSSCTSFAGQGFFITQVLPFSLKISRYFTCPCFHSLFTRKAPYALRPWKRAS